MTIYLLFFLYDIYLLLTHLKLPFAKPDIPSFSFPLPFCFFFPHNPSRAMSDFFFNLVTCVYVCNGTIKANGFWLFSWEARLYYDMAIRVQDASYDGISNQIFGADSQLALHVR